MEAFFGEFIGTAILILLGNGVVANVVLSDSKGENSGWIVITAGWAFAVFVGAFVSAPSSGAHLNPAVSIGLAAAGLFGWEQVPLYVTAQLLGAMVGSGLVWLMYRKHYQTTDDQEGILATFSTGPAIANTFDNTISEIIGTFVLVFGILNIAPAYLGLADTTTPEMLQGMAFEFDMGALGILPVAILVWAIGLSLGGTTGYAINPARDLGPRIMHALLPIKGKGSSDWVYSWIPVLGPIIGAVLAAVVFIALPGFDMTM